MIAYIMIEYQLKVFKQIIHLSELSVCVAFIKGKLESQERIPGQWIIAQTYFRSLTEYLFSYSLFFRHALVGLCESSSLDSHILTITRTPGVL